MYALHYGFREKPFALSPDPRYLFLSASHREVLGHLVYGIEQGEGFMAISGEVGTGKTTLCRTLLERLGSSCEIAFLFNPTLGPTDLIKAINSELGLSTFGDSRAELLDVLNTFLLERHAEERRVLVIIDEAQNLPVETLEQLRLLGNLETHTAKLLQIVLIGQPELDEKLETPELRQLRQRIGVWWRLGPLTERETREYVEHRLRIAGAAGQIFTPRALARVHRASRGVPRLVNLLCDRALLRGYAEGTRRVDHRIVRAVADEVSSPRRARRRRAALATGLGAGAVVLAGVGWLATRGVPKPEPARELAPVSSAPEPAPLAPVARPASAPAPTPDEDEPIRLPGDDNLDALLSLREPGDSLVDATRAALALWGLEPITPSGTTLDDADEILRVAGLTTVRLAGSDLARLRGMDLPALLPLRGADGRERFALLRALGAGLADLAGVVADHDVRIEQTELMRHWSGTALVPWRDFAGLPPSLGLGDAGPPVTWIQDALARLAYYAGPRHGRFDADTREAVEAFQRGAGLAVDGRVGTQTKLALYRSLPDYTLPLLATPAAPANRGT
jgi:general secretion pathway protein A